MNESTNIARTDHNPFQAPDHVVDRELDNWSDAERTRHEYIGHEAAIKAVAGIYVFVGSVVAMASLSGRSSAAVFLAGIVLLATGFGLWRLNRGARIVAAILSPVVTLCAALIFVYVFSTIRWLLSLPDSGPEATVALTIVVYILFLLFGRKGRVVFSNEYRRTINRTPHVHYRTPAAAWILGYALLGTILLASLVYFSSVLVT